MGSSFQNLVAPTQNLGASGDRAPVRQQPWPKENNNYCFSIIAQVIIRATAFSFILRVSSSNTSRNRAAASLKISASVL